MTDTILERAGFPSARRWLSVSRHRLETTVPFEDFRSATLLHRVDWSSGQLMWTEGPANQDKRFQPRPISAGRLYRFAFDAPASNLGSLHLPFGTFGRQNRGSLHFTLRGPAGAKMAVAGIETDMLIDNGFAAVFDLRRLRFTAALRYVLDVFADCLPGNEVAMYVSDVEEPLEGRHTLYLSGAPSRRSAFQAVIRKWDSRHSRTTLAPGDTVVVCTHALPPGGAERQWICLAGALRKAGYCVHFLLCDELTGQYAHYLPTLKETGVEIHYASKHRVSALREMLASDVPLADAFRARVVPDADRLARFVLSLRLLSPKAVFTQLDDPNIYAGLAALLAGVPRVVPSFRNVNPSHFPFIWHPSYRRAYELLGESSRVRFTGNSSEANRDYEAWIGLAPHRATYIPNALCPATFAVPDAQTISRLRQALGLRPDDVVLLGVFRLSPEKNPMLFVEVCARLAVQLPALKVLIAGVGPLSTEVQSRVERCGLKAIVRFLGRRTDVNVLMALSSLMLLTSDREGMPNVILEAQAMGLPVVATAAGGAGEALIAGKTGLLCPVGDADALTNACLSLIRDPTLRQRMGEAGRQHLVNGFTPEVMAERYVRATNVEVSSNSTRTARQPSRPPLPGCAEELPVPSARSFLLRPLRLGLEAECQFFRALRTSNGVFKTTASRRLVEVNEAFATLFSGSTRPFIMDVGASSGITTVEWRDDLLARGYKPEFVATDTMVLGWLRRLASDHYVLTDLSGRILQHEYAGETYAPEVFESFTTSVRQTAFRRRSWSDGANYWHRWTDARGWSKKLVSLTSPRARDISFVVDDVLQPSRRDFEGRFDVVRAANLLNHCYFSTEEITRAVRNLRSRLRIGGIFVVNRTLPDETNHASLFTLGDNNGFALKARVGDGSEIEDIVLGI